MNDPKLSHTRPDYVKHPVQPTPHGWTLGLAQPDIPGYTPDGGFCPHVKFDDAYRFCVEEAASRGISKEAFDATIDSTMFGFSFDHALHMNLQRSRAASMAPAGKAV